MVSLSPTQMVILALVLVAGWLFGLASHPGGRKWKTRYVAERDAHGALRKDNDARLADAQRRIAELERENARLANAAAATPVAGTLVTPRARAVPAARPVGERRGWFDWGTRTPTHG